MTRRIIRRGGLFAGPAREALLPHHAVVLQGRHIAWVGPDGELPAELAAGAAEETDAAGALVTPALIDCHTHIVFAGNRADEFERRLAGQSYAEIAAAGGGIMSTVRALRAATDDELLQGALARLDDLRAQGVRTVEVKSGYGLSLEHELRMLRVARRLAQERPGTRIATTLLAAHALPPEYADRRADYVRLVTDEIIPAAKSERLADAVDVFCEQGAFTIGETDAIFTAARAHGLRVKAHAEQFTASGAAALAARHGALSADHLEFLDAKGAALMAMAGTVAVLLPGAQLTLALPNPPIAALRAEGCAMAIGTDANPGTSHTTNLLLMMQLAAAMYRLSPAECLAGVTASAARALGLELKCGRISPGMEGPVLVWDAERPADLVYRLGARVAARVVG